MGSAFVVPEFLSENDQKSVLNFDCSVNSIVDYIKTKSPTKVVLMVGAGIRFAQRIYQ